ncbi:hypothetical protein JW998_17235 [candidate division KSB1 bacterium]|nr:hypothetical protein [candidate division KSB1 bacterium]
MILALLSIQQVFANSETVQLDTTAYKLYPQVNEKKPTLPSPFQTEDGDEYVVAATKENSFAIIKVNPQTAVQKKQQCTIDTTDFPTLAQTGLHSDEELAQTKMITGRSLAEITDLGRPAQLSEEGFMSAKEDILSLLRTDNQIVRSLGLSHPQLAKPLFHILNMMETDLKGGRWNMSEHEWQNIPTFFYNGNKVTVEAHDTKGGQLSIFDDGIEGAFWIVILRELSTAENRFLQKHYRHLTTSQFDVMKQRLTTIFTGEMEPQYIMRYGFYEGHAGWRTDPIAVAFIFGLKDLEDIEASFPGRLHEILTAEFTHDYNFGEL